MLSNIYKNVKESEKNKKIKEMEELANKRKLKNTGKKKMKS